ncbi:MAG: hypothetical protein WDZ93_00310 [Candidatus Paceibacterota bacterium]
MRRIEISDEMKGMVLEYIHAGGGSTAEGYVDRDQKLRAAFADRFRKDFQLTVGEAFDQTVEVLIRDELITKDNAHKPGCVYHALAKAAV